MINGRIEFSGKTLGDVEAAVSEALSRIRQEHAGERVFRLLRTKDSAFTFELEGTGDAFTDEHAGDALSDWQVQQLRKRLDAQDDGTAPTREDDAPCPCGKSHTVAEHGYDPDA